MKKLSLGMDSTLGNWHRLCVATFGADSDATEFIATKIAAAQQGEQEEVLAEETQLLQVLIGLHKRFLLRPPQDTGNQLPLKE